MKKTPLILLLSFLALSCGSPVSSSGTDNSNENPATRPAEESASSEASVISSSKEVEKLPVIDYVKLYSSLDYDYVYIWKDNVFPCGNWPGKKMSSFDENWVTYDLNEHKELTSFNVIFHDNNGNQSNDLTVSGGPGHYFFENGTITKRDVLPGNEEPVEYDLPKNEKAFKNFYQLLVYSFADSNNDGVGDFKGIKDKLPYLQELGIESIWLSPINKCTSYHAYDVTDYYGVNPSYEVGGYGLTDLIRDAHDSNIEIVLDLVLNHTSNSHPWLREHPSWYGSDDKFGMPEFNFDNSEVRSEMKKIGKYWLDKGVDGFRLDAAMWVYNSGANRHKKNYEWWNEWCSAMRETKSDVYIIAEVLDSNHDLAYDYAQAGFNSTFDFEAMKHVYNATTNPNYDYVGNTLKDMEKAYRYNPNYCLGRPLSNHDVGRFSDTHNDMGDAKSFYLTSFEDLRLANCLNILTPGNTFIYYGDELGLQGTCPQGWDDMKARTPMPFATEKTDSVRYFNGFKGNGVTTSTTLSGQTAEEDKLSSTSLYFSMKKLLNLKIEHSTIKKGKMERLSNTLPNGLNGYLIKAEENIAVVYNSSASAIDYSYTGRPYFTANVNGTSILSKGLLVYTY